MHSSLGLFPIWMKMPLGRDMGCCRQTATHPLPFTPTFQTTQTCLPRQWGQEGCPCLVKCLSHLYVLFFIIFYLCVKSLLCTKLPKEDRFMFHTRWPIQKALSPIWHYVCVPLLWIIKTVQFKKIPKVFYRFGFSLFLIKPRSISFVYDLLVSVIC